MENSIVVHQEQKVGLEIMSILQYLQLRLSEEPVAEFDL